MPLGGFYSIGKSTRKSIFSFLDWNFLSCGKLSVSWFFLECTCAYLFESTIWNILIRFHIFSAKNNFYISFRWKPYSLESLPIHRECLLQTKPYMIYLQFEFIFILISNCKFIFNFTNEYANVWLEIVDCKSK